MLHFRGYGDAETRVTEAPAFFWGFRDQGPELLWVVRVGGFQNFTTGGGSGHEFKGFSTSPSQGMNKDQVPQNLCVVVFSLCVYTNMCVYIYIHTYTCIYIYIYI